MSQETVVVRPRPNPEATRTLLCLGFCGGGAGSYWPWMDVVPQGIALAAVCYPGREGRFAEDFATDWDELAEDVTAAVISAAHQPYVLFGHSMGGWMAFDVTVRIQQRDGPLPDALVVSSVNAPSDGVQRRDMFPAQHETDEQVLRWLHVNGLLPEYVLGDQDLRDMAVELMRADMRVRDSFYYREGTRVPVPLQVLSGAADDVIDPEAAAKWRALAGGDFHHEVLPGGHFYTPEIWTRLPDFMGPLHH